jgi:hypothetical protein
VIVVLLRFLSNHQPLLTYIDALQNTTIKGEDQNQKYDQSSSNSIEHVTVRIKVIHFFGQKDREVEG